VVLGYPGCGSFTASPAAILDEFNASGRDIYGSGLTVRSVYEIQAKVIPGNSGGPLIEKNGQVMGLVFAESTSYQNIGYALSMNKVNTEIMQSQLNQSPVSSGQCAE
ncbi:MAG TPA: trypsin-like serine protease, partial [Patescibacteria group bacterium]|nr:trypsin-like serine protease [Patescibacteria group bacterium]